MDRVHATGEQIVWSPYPVPSHPEKPPPPPNYEPIRLRHPGYEDACNTLLKFWPLDNGGVHHETVRVACAFLANNQWNGYLSVDKAGEHPVDTGPESILRNRSYYFHVAQPADNTVIDYPVIPTFEHWQFPSDLPSYWQTIPSFSQPSRPPEDTSCRITQCEDSVHSAHLVPASQKEWFDNNAMYDYVPSTTTDKMKHANNTIRLKSDIHSIFDSKRFAIVPIEQRLVAYCFNEEPGSQVERLYHGVELHRLRISVYFVHFLLARFAYTVFEHLRGFLDANESRKLRLRLQNEWVVKTCDREKCQAYARATASQGKSRSVSPRKRPKSHDLGEMEMLEAGWSDDEDQRGRKRFRTSESTVSSPSVSFGSTCLSDSPSVATPEAPPRHIHQKDRIPVPKRNLLIANSR